MAVGSLLSLADVIITLDAAAKERECENLKPWRPGITCSIKCAHLYWGDEVSYVEAEKHYVLCWVHGTWNIRNGGPAESLKACVSISPNGRKLASMSVIVTLFVKYAAQIWVNHTEGRATNPPSITLNTEVVQSWVVLVSAWFILVPGLSSHKILCW